jgi:hypothetical protein
MEIAQSTEEALQSHTAARPTNKVNFNGDGVNSLESFGGAP